MEAAELTVSELVAILGQSQPRVSRHLRLLVEAGLATRQREGAWAFFRLAEPGGALAHEWLRRLDPADPIVNADRVRLDIARETRRKQAAAYFATRAADWDQIRALHAPEERVEAALVDMIGLKPFRNLLDLGTGTGRMLELLAPRAARAVGVDQSAAMLALARARIDQAGLRHVSLRQGDIYAPPVERNAYDLVVVHQVLHFLDDPARRWLKPGGLWRRAAGSRSLTLTPTTRNSCATSSPIAGSASRSTRSRTISPRRVSPPSGWSVFRRPGAKPAS